MSIADDIDWGDVFVEYQPKILNYLKRRVKDIDVAEDLTVDVFVKAIDGTQRGVAAQTHFSGWLYRIAHNLMIDYYRARDKQAEVCIDDIAPLAEDFDLHAQTEIKLEVEKARSKLKLLTDEQRAVLIMRAEEGRGFDEIGKAIGKDVGAVKALLHRARTTLVALIEAKKVIRQSRDRSGAISVVMRECGPMTVSEIASTAELTRNVVYATLYSHSDMFGKVDAIEIGKSVIYKWGLVGIHDREAA